MLDDKYCRDCIHWHERPEQDTMIPIGDCDKIKKDTPWKTDDGMYESYDGWSFADEVYDDVFHCFEPRGEQE